jgi:AraC-like DNA-binding protein
MDAARKNALQRIKALPSAPLDPFSIPWLDGLEPPNQLSVSSRHNQLELQNQNVIGEYHQRYVLICVIRGGTTIEVDGKPMHLKSGHILLLMPYQRHSFQSDKRTPIDLLLIGFSLVNGAWLEPLRDRKLPFGRTFLPFLHSFLDLWTTPDPYEDRVAAQWSLGIQLLQMLKQAGLHAGHLQVSEDRNFRSTASRIQSMLMRWEGDKPMRARDIAKKLSISESKLRAGFRASFGESLGVYLKKARLNAAIQMLHQDKKTISEIAFAAGYRSVSSFCRSFKVHTGNSPKRFLLDISRSKASREELLSNILALSPAFRQIQKKGE